jgi:hypothetical protein
MSDFTLWREHFSEAKEAGDDELAAIYLHVGRENGFVDARGLIAAPRRSINDELRIQAGHAPAVAEDADPPAPVKTDGGRGGRKQEFEPSMSEIIRRAAGFPP